MQLISLEGSPASGRTASVATRAEALAGVIGSVGLPDFGSLALAQLNRLLPLCWLSIYQLFDREPPTIHADGTYRACADGTRQSWLAYREGGLYRKDQTFLDAKDHLRQSGGVLTHWHANEISPEHRDQIYTRHGLRERLSIVSNGPQGGVLAINLYRRYEDRVFSDTELDLVRELATPLMACASLHVRSGQVQPVQADLVPDQYAFLAVLPKREREVCDRLLRGWTQDGVAADLGLSPRTVKTYRDRAFERLGIRYRHELFAMVLNTQPG